ncbi:MAG: hypothetical protein ACJAVF_001190 [Paraglaciecola sp.]|jgi:hypothetical protein
MKFFKTQFLLTLSLVFIVCSCSNLLAQPFFNHYGNADNESFQQIEYVSTSTPTGGGYFAVGSIEDPNDVNSRLATFSCLEADGDLIWTKTYHELTSFTSFAYDIGSQEFMLCGYKGLTNPTRQLLTVKVNIFGSPVCPIQELVRPNTSRILGAKIIRTNEVAETYIIMSWWNLFSSIDDLSLLKIDACGNPIWWNDYRFGGGADDQFLDLAPWGNGGCVVAGNSSGTGWRATILPVSSNGVANTAVVYNSDPEDCTFQSIELTPTGNYLVSGQFGQGTATDALLMYLDGSLNAMWGQRYTTANSESMNAAVEINNEIFTGMYLPDGTGRSLHISKFNLLGNYMETKHLAQSYETSAYANAKLGHANLPSGADYLTVIDLRNPVPFGGTWDVAMGAMDLNLDNCETVLDTIPFEFFELPTNTQNPQVIEVSYDINQFEDFYDITLEQASICEDDCGEMVIDTLTCNPDGSFNISFHLINNTPYVVAASFFSGIAPGGIFNPTFMNVNIPANGGVSPIFNTVFTPNNTVVNPTPYCFTVSYFNLENDVCCHFETCITLDPCDPCDKEFIDLAAMETPGTTDGCCHSIDVTNNWVPNYFTKIRTNLLTPGVDFAGETAGTGWDVSGTATSLDWTGTGGIPIPTGLSSQAMNFCFDNIQNWSQTPQQVEFEWITIDAMGEESIVCVDTLTFYCEPCVKFLEEDITCLPDGCIDYTFTIQNNTANSSSSPQNVDMVAILFQTPGLTITPSPTSWNITLPPGATTTQTITICGATAGQSIDFKFLLINGNIDIFDWCCHTEQSIIMPDCDQNPDCIDQILIDPSAICIAIFEPVCGCDNITYFNDCFALNYAGVTSWTPGICPLIQNPLPPFDLVAVPLNNNAVILTWELEDDEAQIFILQRKSANGDWEIIAEIEGSAAGPYEYLDEAPESETNIYQVIAGQPTGEAIFSNEAEVFINNEPTVIIFPNPAMEYIQLKVQKQVENTEIRTAHLVSSMGELAAIKTLQAGQLNYEFDVSGLSPGLYFIYLEKANGTAEKIPFVIERSR